MTRLLWAERYIDPYFRPAFDAVVRQRIQTLVQWWVRRRLPPTGLALAEERLLPDEQDIVRDIVSAMERFTRRQYPPGEALRAGNTKTYGVVRGALEIRADIPEHLRHGLFGRPGSYPAWIRFAGPGPLAPADLHDNAIMTIGVKVMGVQGPKLLTDESLTQDFLGISSPTFTTPNVRENLKLQQQVWNRTPLLYFIRPGGSHFADLIMQGLYAKTAASPLQVDYWSCVPYLLGDGQAMQYRFVGRPFPGLRVPRRPGADYLREAMVSTLDAREVQFDLQIQLQTDPDAMPIENAGVVWPDRLSKPESVAVLRVWRQRFDSPQQRAFAGNLALNPWHCLAEHRPLGNQNRARLAIYSQLSRLRQEMNGTPHIEPTGSEEFPDEHAGI